MTRPDPRDYLDGEDTTPEQWERYQRAIRDYAHFEDLRDQADEQRRLEELARERGEYFVESTR